MKAYSSIWQNFIYEEKLLKSNTVKGLAKILVNQALIVAQKADCNAAIVLAVSDYASKIFINLGMEVFAEKEWKDCIFDGIRPFGNVRSKNAIGYFMKINDK